MKRFQKGKAKKNLKESLTELDKSNDLKKNPKGRSIDSSSSLNSLKKVENKNTRTRKTIAQKPEVQTKRNTRASTKIQIKQEEQDTPTENSEDKMILNKKPRRSLRQNHKDNAMKKLKVVKKTNVQKKSQSNKKNKRKGKNGNNANEIATTNGNSKNSKILKKQTMTKKGKSSSKGKTQKKEKTNSKQVRVKDPKKENEQNEMYTDKSTSSDYEIKNEEDINANRGYFSWIWKLVPKIHS